MLRGELGFNGVVVSDWEDIKKLVTIHRAAADREGSDAAVGDGRHRHEHGAERLQLRGPADRSWSRKAPFRRPRIDEAVSRILTMKARLGLFDEPLRGTDADAARRRPRHASRR